MTTPEEAVREARENVLITMRNGNSPVDLSIGDRDHDRIYAHCERENEAELDALLTAERARLAARVEGMEMPHYRRRGTTTSMKPDCFALSFPGPPDNENCDCGKSARDYALSQVIALLREGA